MNRIYHAWWKWECYKAGFYDPAPPKGMSKEDCKEAYADFLSKPLLFTSSMERVFKEWPHSSEHFLTNSSINRIAWLGQSSMCIATGISSEFKSGFFLLSETDQRHANMIADNYLKRWLNEHASKG